MANKEHLKILKQGVEVWNKWREDNPDLLPDLSDANLINAELNGANFGHTDLSRANLSKAELNNTIFIGSFLNEAKLRSASLTKADLSVADLTGADFTGAMSTYANFSEAFLNNAKFNLSLLCRVNLSLAEAKGAFFIGTDFHGAHLIKANLCKSFLQKADLSKTDLTETDLTEADLRGANLIGASLVKTKMNNADLTGCKVFGVSVWNIKTDTETKQQSLIITDKDEPVITVDDLEVAQFIYLLLNNKKIRHVIDTITSKVVLILGRFTKPRKAVLDAIREELRQHDYLPVIFDFDKPASRDIHETVGTLARMARFVIADITNPRCIPQELVSIVEQLPSLPVQPLLKYGSKPWGMYDHIKRYPWVLEIHKYRNLKSLLGSIRERVIAPAEEKWLELNQKS